jgi:hypothetical protein
VAVAHVGAIPAVALGEKSNRRRPRLRSTVEVAEEWPQADPYAPRLRERVDPV